MKNAAQAYFQTQVSTTDQGQLLLMLYDGALNFLQQARDKMLAKDYAAKGLLISKTIDIVTELSNTLNMEKGGTLAENLNNLYFLCTARLLQANLKMNVEQLDSVVGILSGLRSAYAQIIETPEAQQASAQIATRMKTDASMSQRAAPIMAPPVMPSGVAGKVLARAAYGQQAAHTAASSVPPAASVGSDSPAAPATGRPAVSVPSVPLAVPVIPVAAQQVAAAPQAPASVQPAVTIVTASVPAAPEKPQGLGAGLGAGLGGLNKRMSGYGKFAQGA